MSTDDNGGHRTSRDRDRFLPWMNRFGTARVRLWVAAIFGVVASAIVALVHYFIVGVGPLPEPAASAHWTVGVGSLTFGYAFIVVPGFVLAANFNNIIWRGQKNRRP